MQPFRFEKIQLTDDEGITCKDEKTLQSLGTVEVSYHYVSNVRAGERLDVEEDQHGNVFDEKAKKAQLSHQATSVHLLTFSLVVSSLTPSSLAPQL